MIWILDASVAVRWFIQEEAHKNADLVLTKIVDEPERFAVPELFTFEVFSVLARIHPEGAAAFRKGLLPLLQVGILRQPMTEGLCRGADHFLRLGLTGYDACYAALAKELEGFWLTFDADAHRKIAHERVSTLLSEGLPPGW